jgi:hypothetical protein
VYSRLPSFVLGFHGCDHAFAAAVISGRKRFTPSQNDYDWLGTGIYFWENNPQRAVEFATALRGKGRKGKPVIRKPAVIEREEPHPDLRLQHGMRQGLLLADREP